MSKLQILYNRLISGMNVPGLKIPLTAVKFFKKGDKIPEAILAYITEDLTLTSCQANKQASLGDAVLLTRENIGCIAAAITFGLVDQHDSEPLAGPRVYTDIMKDQSNPDKNFKPPSPQDFTEGLVYACKAANKTDFCLFGSEDSGRFKTAAIAKKAVAGMIAIQPPTTQGVFFFSKDFDDMDIDPDVVVLSVKPAELTRIAQAYQYLTGERVKGDMGPVRVVNSDLIVRPYLSGEINFSSYCLGARLIAQYEYDRLGIGIPFEKFKTIVQGMEESKGGYPFQLYPGAKEINFDE